MSRDGFAVLPTSPFAPVIPLILTPADTELSAFLRAAHALIESCPQLLAAIEADLDRHALRKKAARVADAQWHQERTLRLFDMPEPLKDIGKPLALLEGRPRTPAYVVLLAMFLRGYSGAGFKSSDVTCLMQESVSLHILFFNLGMEIPGRSTLTELVNAVSNETRLLVLDAELAQVLSVKFDDFKTILQDSTHVGGNTAWPTDSRLMVELITRLLHIGTRLDRVGLPVFQSPEAEALLDKMVILNREIDFSKGKKGAARKRKRHYQRLLKMSAQVDGLVTAQLAPLTDALFALDVRPSQKEQATRALERLRVDLAALAKVREACEARVIHNEKVPMSEKVLSVSDPDAGFISKGQRDPVIGYKPQIARSGGGFIVGLSLPKGNAADSKQLIPMLEDVMFRTQVIPNVVSVDDGYASSDNKKALEKLGIDVISINGAKGKALSSAVDWESDEYAEARGKRSAVESVMFTLKESFDFGEVARRGLDAVYAEQLERVFAFNLCHLVRRLRAAAKAAAEGKAAA